MRQEPAAVRGLLLILIAGLLVPAAGCITGERRANAAWNRIGEGLTKEGVRELVGPGDPIANPDGSEVWHYSYGSRPDPRQIAVMAGKVLAVLTVIGAYVVMVGMAGHGPPQEPSFDGAFPRMEGPGITASRVHFKVVFDPAGKVTSISGLEPCPE